MTVDPYPPDWTCRCGGINPPDFGTCWICGEFEEGTEDLFDVPPGRTVSDVPPSEALG